MILMISDIIERIAAEILAGLIPMSRRERWRLLQQQQQSGNSHHSLMG